MTKRICIDCKHCIVVKTIKGEKTDSVHFCDNPVVKDRYRNCVTGEYTTVECISERSFLSTATICGTVGTLYEERP